MKPGNNGEKEKLFEKLKDGLNDIITKITTTEINTEQLQSILWDFKLTLIQNDVAVSVAEHICEEIEKQMEDVKVKRGKDRVKIVEKALRRAIFETLDVDEEIDLLEMVRAKKEKKKPCVVVFVGINGSGKTTTIAKIANLLMKKGYSVVLTCSDTYRAGSIEQLEEHARRLGVPVIKHNYGSDPAAVAFDAVKHAETKGINVVLVDTAGRIQTNVNLMMEMKKIVRVVNPNLIIFVGDALTGNDVVMQAQEFSKFVDIDAAILTKSDADAKGGAAISITRVTGKPVIFLGVGQEYDDLETFKPELLVDMILG